VPVKSGSVSQLWRYPTSSFSRSIRVTFSPSIMLGCLRVWFGPVKFRDRGMSKYSPPCEPFFDDSPVEGHVLTEDLRRPVGVVGVCGFR